MISIVDYGVGNLKSIKNAIDYIGKSSSITNDIGKLKESKYIVLPGVGAFDHAIKKLKEEKLFNEIKKLNKDHKFLCICLGMQLLFENSSEGSLDGLGIVKGKVENLKKISDKKLIPNIGWRKLISKNQNKFSKIFEGQQFYHLHSYYCVPKDKSLIQYTIEFDKSEIPVCILKDNILGLQFHPEKSREQGLKVLKYFFCEF